MTLRMLGLGALLAAVASAVPITYSGSGTFTAVTTTTTLTAPNATFAFSFVIDSSPTVTNNDGFSFRPAFSQISYILNGSAVVLPNGHHYSVYFYESFVGMFFLDAIDGVLEFDGPQMFSGPMSAPTMLPGSFTSTDFLAGYIYAPITHETNITVTAVAAAAPEPATFAPIALGLLGILARCRYRRSNPKPVQ